MNGFSDIVVAALVVDIAITTAIATDASRRPAALFAGQVNHHGTSSIQAHLWFLQS